MAQQSSSADHILLGLDTGGTYTDAVLIDGARMGEGPSALIAKAKALTTRDDLSRGIGEAVDKVLAAAKICPSRIALVSLSTTLATNALVEGQGGRSALVMIGFEPEDLGRQGLAEAIGDDPLLAIAGGHDPLGAQRVPLDVVALGAALDQMPGDIGAYAVCGHFAVRNPAHEQAAAQEITLRTGRPVTCSHQLSAKVGGPKRGLTALLNARLIAMIARLIESARQRVSASGIAAPLMVVRGDGALVSAEYALERPVETILSGPAASLVGAGWLTGLSEAIVSDIGGTTTDIAVLRQGRPRIDPDGAQVGGLRTMVEAVAMRTHGLGGDSAVRLVETGPEAGLTLGPARRIPISLLAKAHPGLVHAMLDRQLAGPRVDPQAGRCFIALGAGTAQGVEEPVLARLRDGPVAADQIATGRAARRQIQRLIARGQVAEAGFTPSDAAHVTGMHTGWDQDAAEKAATLFARQRGRTGQPLAEDARAMSQQVIDLLTRRSAERVLETAFSEDGFDGIEITRSPLVQAALDGHRGLTAPRFALQHPVIGLGASAQSYYPGVGAVLGAEVLVPAHADVANALGAVVGHVRLTRQATISAPSSGLFRAHLPAGPQDFTDFDEAESALRLALISEIKAAAEAAGAEDPDIVIDLTRKTAEIEGKEMVIEAELSATAIGRPRLATPAEPGPQTLPTGFSGL
ncbi:MAG: hydantoinase/oxoprolinase family protein [Pseudomonadota bacterium]